MTTTKTKSGHPMKDYFSNKRGMVKPLMVIRAIHIGTDGTNLCIDQKTAQEVLDY